MWARCDRCCSRLGRLSKTVGWKKKSGCQRAHGNRCRAADGEDRHTRTSGRPLVIARGVAAPSCGSGAFSATCNRGAHGPCTRVGYATYTWRALDADRASVPLAQTYSNNDNKVSLWGGPNSLDEKAEIVFARQSNGALAPCPLGLSIGDHNVFVSNADIRPDRTV